MDPESIVMAINGELRSIAEGYNRIVELATKLQKIAEERLQEHEKEYR